MASLETMESRGCRVCVIICVILRLAILIQYCSVTDRHTHTHTMMAYTALSIASHGKNEGVLKVTGNHVHFRSGSISERC